MKIIFRGFRGLLEALVEFCKGSEDFEKIFRGLQRASGGFGRILRCFGGIQEALVGFRGLQRASEGFRGLQRASEGIRENSAPISQIQLPNPEFRGLYWALEA